MLAEAEAGKAVAPLADNLASDDEDTNLSLAATDMDAGDTDAIRHTASIADPGLFEPLTEERLEAEAAALPVEPQPVELKVELASGETLMEVLQKAGVDRIDAYHAVAAMTPHYSPRKLRA